jgi:hypothetical protein
MDTIVTSTEGVRAWAACTSPELLDRFGECRAIGADLLASREPSPRTWSELLMAVGNIKRQAKIHPMAWSDGEVDDGDRRQTLRLPSIELDRDDLQSWRELTKIVGLQVPTATMVLAALWPANHATLDRWTFDGAVGLMSLTDQLPQRHDGNSAQSLSEPDWEDYNDVFLPLIKPNGGFWDHGLALPEAEQGLFNAARSLPGQPGRTWADYGIALKTSLNDGPHRLVS